MGPQMAKNYIAVRRGFVDNTVFVCTGAKPCNWFDHVWPLIEGTTRQEFEGFDTLDEALAYIVCKYDVGYHVVQRDRASTLVRERLVKLLDAES